MSAKVEIYDGSPWWASTDIWVVPGNDPNGSPGQPLAGQPNYLWANVHNTGTQNISGIQVNFYWSNPATGVLRSTSTLIGVGFVDLIPGETKEVLCISPWMATIVNNGHECLVAEAVAAEDPLPASLPDAFDPPTYHQIAQKNVHVLTIMPEMAFIILPIQISASSRSNKHIEIQIEKGDLSKEVQHKLLAQFGLKGKFQHKPGLQYGLSEKDNCSYSKDIVGKHSLEMKVEEQTSKCVYVHIAQSQNKQAGYEILNVTEAIDKKIVGGNTLIIFKK